MLDVWPDSEAEAALQALELVLQGVPGVAYVNRQAIRASEVSSKQLPCILIDDTGADYDWIQRQGGPGRGRRLRVASNIRLELIAEAGRERGAQFNRSTVRTAFITAVLSELTNNPTLAVPDETGALIHTVEDCCQSGFQVRNRPVPEPYVSAIVTIQLDLYECLDNRSGTTWQNIILTLYPEGSAEPLPEITINLE